MIKGYTDTDLTVPCCQSEADVFETKRRNCIGGFISTAIIPDPGTEGWKQKGRQAETEAEREKECINTRGGGKP